MDCSISLPLATEEQFDRTKVIPSTTCSSIEEHSRSHQLKSTNVHNEFDIVPSISTAPREQQSLFADDDNMSHVLSNDVQTAQSYDVLDSESDSSDNDTVSQKSDTTVSSSYSEDDDFYNDADYSDESEVETEVTSTFNLSSNVLIIIKSIFKYA